LRNDAPSVIRELVPNYEAEYAQRGWKMFPTIDRVYSSQRAREELAWEPRFDFRHTVTRLQGEERIFSELALAVGSKGSHAEVFEDGRYPVSE
jgi:UDP-glucose 4-epimerase